MSRRRQLSEEERALWSSIARSITPLPGSQTTATAATSAPSESERAPPPAAPSPATRPEAPADKRPPPLAPLGRRLKQRVVRGREPIDGRLDLHGKTQSEAHAALLRFLRRAQGDGAKLVLVVTGKGTRRETNSRSSEGPAERGVLRRQVPLWLALPEFRPFVVAFEDAHIFHGGEGALYVRLRRSR
jgi:DNA-nicking Smr family endonuclease